LTAPQTLAAIDRFLEEYPDAEIAEHLNQEGYRTFDGLRDHAHACLPTPSGSWAPRSVYPLARPGSADGRRTGSRLRRHCSNYLAVVSPGAHCGAALQ
jgi:hypothetical protein